MKPHANSNVPEVTEPELSCWKTADIPCFWLDDDDGFEDSELKSDADGAGGGAGAPGGAFAGALTGFPDAFQTGPKA